MSRYFLFFTFFFFLSLIKITPITSAAEQVSVSASVPLSTEWKQALKNTTQKITTSKNGIKIDFSIKGPDTSHVNYPINCLATSSTINLLIYSTAEQILPLINNSATVFLPTQPSDWYTFECTIIINKTEKLKLDELVIYKEE